VAAQAADAAQEDEREALKAIFMDDYEESEAKGAWSVSS
jgi:translation initiation factor 2-alpha kinase 4